MPKEIPIWEKSNLTLEEAAVYFNIGINKLRELSDSDNCSFVLWVGNKRLIKREKLDDYLSKMYSI
jgi:excisionase family DNA binding protein